MDIKFRQKITDKQRFRIITKIKQSEIIELPENKFNELVNEVEDSQLFKKLAALDNENKKIISYKRFPRTDLSMKFLELHEETSIDKSKVEVESLINSQKEAVLIIKKIGISNFKKYFLYDELENSIENISRICEISKESVRKVTNLVDKLAVYDEFFSPSNITNDSGLHYNKIVKIEIDKSGELLINFFSPKYSQGKYVINYEQLEKMKELKSFSKDELTNISEIIEKLELINRRKTIVFQIIEKLIIKQRKYFISGDESEIVPFTQREFASQIVQSESLISRAILNKSIETPLSVEISVQSLFPSEKDIRKRIIKKIIEKTDKHLTDNKIKCILMKDYDIDISRRTVAVCRKELEG